MKIQLIDFGGRSPERAHANDAGADVFSPRELYVSCHPLIPDIQERFMQLSPMSETGNMKSRWVTR